MKIQLLVISILTTAVCFSVHARDYYGYERVGRDDAEYVYINGDRYARVPQKEVVEVQPRYQVVNYNEGWVSEPRYQRQSYQQPRYYEVSKRSSFDVRPYIGLDAGMSTMKINDKDDKYGLKDLDMKMGDIFDTKHTNFSGVLGLKINPYLAVELFYQKALESEKTIFSGNNEIAKGSIKDTLSYKALGVDVIGHKPLNDVLDILFGVGLAQYSFDGKVSRRVYNYTTDNLYKLDVTDDEDVMAVRLGLGLQYYLTDHIALQAMGRYIHMFDDDIVKHMIEMSLGVRYLF